MEEKTIKSISPVPLGLIMGSISAIAGLIACLFLAVFYLPFAYTISENFNPIPGSPTTTILPSALTIIIILAIPIISFAMGFLQGFLSAVVYNFLAPRIGGIKIKLEETSKKNR